jgi:hypothetical protein
MTGRVVGSSLRYLLPLALLLPEATHAHGVLKSPTARDGMADGVGRKITPFPLSEAATEACDGTLAAEPVATVHPGMRVVIKYEVGIPHPAAPGLRLAISQPDTAAGGDKLKPFADLATGGGQPTILADDDGKDVGAEGEHDISLVIPGFAPDGPLDAPGDGFVLQWMWQSESDGGGYIGCADIRIQPKDSAEPCGVFTSEQPAGTPNRLVTELPACKGSSQSFLAVVLLAVLVVAVLAVMYAPQLEGVRTAITSSAVWQKATALVLSPRGLPPNWEAVHDGNDTYYYNSVTGESRWDRPTMEVKGGGAPPPPPPAAPGGYSGPPAGQYAHGPAPPLPAVPEGQPNAPPALPGRFPSKPSNRSHGPAALPPRRVPHQNRRP